MTVYEVDDRRMDKWMDVRRILRATSSVNKSHAKILQSTTHAETLAI